MASGGDEHWDPQFGTNGLNDAGFAIEVSSSGDVYVGGRFTMAGGVPASRIARWDGTTWHALGSGVNDDVVAIGVSSSDDVYVGGFFSQAGGNPAERIAHFDGATWDPMDGGANDFVEDIAIDSNGDVYAAGFFTEIGGVTTTGIARWDGANWNSVGGGVNGGVSAVIVHSSGDVYIGGSFTMAGGTPVQDVARWDGAQWHDVGAIIGSVRTLSESPTGEVFVGGAQLTASQSNVARWDEGSQTWVGVGPPFYAGTNCIYNASTLAISSTHFYAGNWELICFPPASADYSFSAAEWDGNNWLPLGSATNGDVWSVGLAGDDLFVTGFFTEAGANPSLYFGRWNETLILENEPAATAPAQVRVIVAPNPSVSEPQLQLFLEHPAEVRATVYDARGRLVRELATRDLSTGNHTIDVGRYDSGVYLIVVELINRQGEFHRITRKMTIID